jgi:hypothetical protein
MKNFLFVLFFLISSSAQAAVTFRWANNPTASTTQASSASVTNGANTITNGDLLIAIVVANNWTPAAPGSISAPAGWTQVVQQTGNGLNFGGTDVQGAIYYKIASSESPPYSFTWTTASSFNWTLLDYTGANSSTPFEASAAGTTTNGSTSLIAPSISPANSNSMEICAWNAGGNAGAFTPPGTMTTRVNNGTGAFNVAYMAVSELQLAASGSTATQTLTQVSNSFGLQLSAAIITGGGVTVVPKLPLMGVGP